MLDLDELQEILSTLRRNALRTTLTAVGVFWGVLMLMVMVGFGNGLEGGVKRDMGGTSTNSLFVWGSKTSIPFKGRTPGRFVPLTTDDARKLEQLIPEIEVVAPRANLGGRGGSDLVTRGDKSGSFSVSGDVPAYFRIQATDLVAGRFINQLDLDRRRKVAVIGNNVADQLFARGVDPIGKSIQIRRSEFVVVGVHKSPMSGDRGERAANTIYTPLTTFQQTLRPEKWVNNLAVLVRDGASVPDVEQRVRLELAKIHGFSPDDKQALGSWNADEDFRKINGLFYGISMLIWFVGAVTLAAGIIGVSNIMMISVRERTREIGVRRAIGATPWTIIAQILKESTLLTAAAGYAGLAAGVGALELIGGAMKPAEGAPSSGMFDPPHVEFGVGLAATLLVILGGALAGLFPALHAVRVPPVVALRDE